MPDDLILEAVSLGIDAARQHQHALGQLGAVLLAPAEHGFFVGQLAAILP